MISTAVIMSALELGCIYALVALALFLSFRVLNIADMTTDGSFTLTADTVVNITLNIHPADYNNRTVYPVLVEGSEAGGFYA